MPEQYYEKYRPDMQQFSSSNYEDVPRYNDYGTGIADQQKLSIRKYPSLWQRIGLAIVSLVLWACTLLCFLLAWDYTWSHDLGYIRFILVIVPLFLTPFFIFVNILFNRKH